MGCMGPPAAEMLAGRGVSFFAASAATCDFSLTTGMDKDMKAIKKEESCALSSACCSVMQELGQIDINEDPAKALKEANALQERMGPACGNQDDGMAMQKCMGPKPAADDMVVEPRQMMVGFGGFLVGASVVGLAVGLKRRSQPLLEEPLMA